MKLKLKVENTLFGLIMLLIILLFFYFVDIKVLSNLEIDTTNQTNTTEIEVTND